MVRSVTGGSKKKVDDEKYINRCTGFQECSKRSETIRNRILGKFYIETMFQFFPLNFFVDEKNMFEKNNNKKSEKEKYFPKSNPYFV